MYVYKIALTGKVASFSIRVSLTIMDKIHDTFGAWTGPKSQFKIAHGNCKYFDDGSLFFFPPDKDYLRDNAGMTIFNFWNGQGHVNSKGNSAHINKILGKHTATLDFTWVAKRI